MIDLSVIIVTWNSRRDLERCLPSLAGAAAGIQMELLVVDNASDDGSNEVASRLFPGARLILNSTNAGFAAANNQALREAGGRHVCLLNPDTVLRQRALAELVRYLDGHPDVWACGPAMENGDGTPQRTGVRFPVLWTIFVESLFLDRLFTQSRVFGRHRELYADPTQVRAVDYLQGACLMVRRDVIARAGLLDEGFFMYFEETDWCYRMKTAGGAVHYCPIGTVVHFGGGAFAHFDERRIVYYHRSLLRFFRKHYGWVRRAAVRPILLMRTVIRILLWGVLVLMRPSARRESLSSLKGYLRVVAVLAGRVE